MKLFWSKFLVKLGLRSPYRHFLVQLSSTPRDWELDKHGAIVRHGTQSIENQVGVCPLYAIYGVPDFPTIAGTGHQAYRQRFSRDVWHAADNLQGGGTMGEAGRLNQIRRDLLKATGLGGKQ